MLAEFTLIGRIGKIFDRRSDETPVAYGITVATEEAWKDKDDWKSKTYWHYLSVMSGREVLAQKFEVGDRIYAHGILRPWKVQGDAADPVQRHGVDMVLQDRRILERSKKDRAAETDKAETAEAGDNSVAA